MTAVTTRAGKGAALTNAELDANFTNLNNGKVEKAGDVMTGTLRVKPAAGASVLGVDGLIGQDRYVGFYENGVVRWILNAAQGSGHLMVARYDAAGNNQDVPLYFDKGTGQAVFGYRPNFNGYAPWDSGNLPNPMQKIGGTFTGPVVYSDGGGGDVIPQLNTGPGKYRYHLYSTNGTARWTQGVSNAGEAGANAGSDWFIGRYADNGAYIDVPFTVSRATGTAVFSQRPNWAGFTPWDSGNLPTPAQKADIITGGTGTYDTRRVIAATFNAKIVSVTSADYIRLVRADGSTLRVALPGTLNCDISVAGPAAGGRDQAAAFPDGSFVTLYLIYNDSTGTMSTVWSANQITPNALPPGYTSWARAAIFRIGAAQTLVSQRWTHRTATYNADTLIIGGGVASAGAEQVLTAVMQNYVPTVAVSFVLNCLGQITVGAGNPVFGQYDFRTIAGGWARSFTVIDDNTGSTNGERRVNLFLPLENSGYLSIAGTFSYGSQMNLYARVDSYTIP